MAAAAFAAALAASLAPCARPQLTDLPPTTSTTPSLARGGRAAVASPAAPTPSDRVLEPAGAAYHAAQRHRAALRAAAAAGHHGHHHHHHRGAAAAGGAGDSSSGSDSESEDDSDAAERKRLMLALGSDDHYAMLGLGALNVNASDEQVRRAYRALVLKYHPDKMAGAGGAGGGGAAGSSSTSTPAAASGGSGSGAGGVTDPLFLAIQKAYDVLSNDKSRRAYDSVYEFDDSIPSGSETLATDDAFYALYGPVFERNARWSHTKPVPRLGGADTPDAAVRAFYAFWHDFDSWRDFSAAAEHNADEADARDERRWMQRENERAIAKKRKAEVARINDLTSRAQARDPRVARMEREEEEARRAAREARAAGKRAEEEARRAREAAAAAAAAAEEEARKAEVAARKAAKDRDKRALKRMRADLRRALTVAGGAAAGGAAGGAGGGEGGEGVASPATPAADTATGAGDALPDDAWEVLAGALDMAALTALLAATTVAGSGPGGLPAAAAVVADAVAGARRAAAAASAEAAAATAAAAAAAAATAAAAAAAAAAKREREWTVQEASMLAKGVARYPPGTRNRWVMIAEYVTNAGLGEPRNADECIAKARVMGEEDRRKANAQAFAVYLSARGTEPEIRDKDAPSTAAGAPPVARVTIAASTAAAVPVVPVAPVVPVVPVAAAPAAAAAASGGSASAAAAKGGDDDAAGGGEDGGGEAGVWTAAQQTALEKALRDFPASMEKNERWKAIAGAVPGKSKKECIARFKEVRERVLAAKGGAAPAAAAAPAPATGKKA